MRTTDAVTQARGLPVGYALLALVYVGLAVAVARLLRRLARPVRRRRPRRRCGGRGDRAMSLAEVCAALIVAGLTAYAVLAGADFGAGFWDLVAGGAERGARVRGLVERSMAPGLGGQPRLADLRAGVLLDGVPARVRLRRCPTLYVPLFLAGVGIILRGSAFAFRGQAVDARRTARCSARRSRCPRCSRRSSSARRRGGRLGPRAGRQRGAATPSRAWLNPMSVLVGVLAVVARGAYLAAVYLAADAERAGPRRSARGFRARALVTGVVAGALAVGGLVVVHADAPALFDGLTGGAGLALRDRLGRRRRRGARAGVARGRFDGARVCAAVAVAAVMVGWGVAQHPYCFPAA